MFRCVCLSMFVALLSGFTHAQMLLSTPESFPTSPQAMDETDAPRVAPTTPDFANTVTDSTTTEFWAFSVTSSSSLETSVPAEVPNSTDTPTAEPTQGPTPSPTNATTVNPTNATTVNPTNASTTAVPTTPPPLPNPTVGDYSIKSDPKSSACLKAKMGLQFRYKLGESFQTINLEPNVTNASGLCGNNGSDSTLSLKSELLMIQFLFVNQSNKFHLSAMNFTLSNGSATLFDGRNSNMSLWEASLGSSYMCRKEQTFNITESLVMNTFELQVQPFGLTEDKFSTAHECSMDDTSLLIPIIVGAALAGLILIVVIAYVIGRRKTYVGYQTL